MLMPKKVKFRKQQRGRRRGVASRGAKVSFGDYGLQALEVGWVTARQIEAARIAMTRHVKRGGKIWIRIFPAQPVPTTPRDTRLERGCPSPEAPPRQAWWQDLDPHLPRQADHQEAARDPYG